MLFRKSDEKRLSRRLGDGTDAIMKHLKEGLLQRLLVLVCTSKYSKFFFEIKLFLNFESTTATDLK